MSREKIISLAIRCNILNEIEMLDSNPWRQDTIRELTEFYHAAQAEAFEAAAVKCHEVKNNSRHHLFRSAAKICAAAIREMAKEMK